MEEYHENGQLKKKGNYKNWNREGPWEYYDEEGNLEDGLCETYHDNGQLHSKFHYKNVKFEGPWVFYHDNGQLMSKGTYKDGKKVK